MCGVRRHCSPVRRMYCAHHFKVDARGLGSTIFCCFSDCCSVRLDAQHVVHKCLVRPRVVHHGWDVHTPIQQHKHGARKAVPRSSGDTSQVCVCVRVCVRACVRVRACACVCAHALLLLLLLLLLLSSLTHLHAYLPLSSMCLSANNECPLLRKCSRNFRSSPSATYCAAFLQKGHACAFV